MRPAGVVTCPACGKPTSGAARRCAHCGAGVSQREPSQRSAALRCPNCEGAPQAILFGGVELDGCLACGGVWFDDREVNALAAELSDEELASAALQAARALGADARAGRKARAYFPCPVCHEVMARANYHDVSGVILHRCDGHGAWLDHANVLRFLTLVSNGGMRELDRRAVELRTQRELRQLSEVEEMRRELLRKQEAEAETEEERRDARTVQGGVSIIAALLGLLS